MNNQPKATMEEIVLAALLHDIGKFLQRRQSGSYKSPDKENICPMDKNKNYYTHIHSLFTDGYLQKMNDDGLFPENVNGERVQILASKHHLPATAMQYIIAKADWLSSGCDRSSVEISENSNKYYEQPLRNIFDKISFGNTNDTKENFYALKQMNAENIFPDSITSLSQTDYAKYFDRFHTDLKKLKNLKYSLYIQTLNSILEHYLWCIPSSTIDEPDISLYDHLVTTAAFAATLYCYHKETNTLYDVNAIKDDSDKKFLFVSGDISGIQSYLFDLRTSKNAAKILRARSFEIQGLSEVVAYYILEQLGLPIFSRIMNAGGRFILLLPNTKSVKEKLRIIKQDLEQYCLEHYLGELTLNISDGVEVCGKELQITNSKQFFLNLTKDVQLAKEKKLSFALKSTENHILDNYYSKFSSSQDLCVVCGKKPVEKQGDELCEDCLHLSLFGSKLPKAQFIFYSDVNVVKKSNYPYLQFPFNKIIGIAEKEDDLPSNVFPYQINYFTPIFPTIYTPYYIPTDNKGDVLTFEELADKSEGREHIAMFKADLDNLGAIFSIGIRKLSISRYATLSRMLHMFFSAYVNHLIKTNFSNIYTVFSGGDDLCVIGPWTDVLNFSKLLQKEFKRFAGNNETISISGGIALASKKLPVKNIAHNAEEYLDYSKSKDSKKNKITLFGCAVSWNKFETLIEKGNKLDDYLQKGNITTGFVYRLLEYAKRHNKVQNGDVSGVNPLWRSHLSYDCARNIKNNKVRDEVLGIVQEEIENLTLTASYVLYKNREN